MTRLYNYRTDLRKADGPCKDCPDRNPGCRSKCEKYINWKAERQILLDRKKAQTDLNDAIIALNYNTHTSIKKQQHKRK